jgi:SAM-dependent methyltransferase
MPTVGDNLKRWTQYDWEQRGDEWSEVWGGSDALWWGALRPRLLAFLPVPSILEIAPGYGRFTHYLKDLCQHLVVIDLTERCIAACRERFRGEPNIEYFVNDGKSLALVADDSIDFAFSFDSLVHAEAEVLKAYVEQLARKLTKDGVAFLHHSNVGAFVNPVTGKLPFENKHWRAESMSADLMNRFCAASGLAVVSQEVVNWGCPHLTDCFSLFTGTDSKYAGPRQVVENPRFMDEALQLGSLARLYHRWEKLGLQS